MKYIPTLAHRKAVSRALTGIKRPYRPLSKSHRLAISRGRKGIKFTKEHCEAIRKARLGTKASPQARINLSKAAKARAAKPGWKKRVSEGTKRALKNPETRKKFLTNFRKAFKERGPFFKGGNGQPPVPFVKSLYKVLKPLGYKIEHAIGFVGRKGNYKVDFALIERKIAIECDGKSHRSKIRKQQDKKKDKVLRAMGWKVIRVPHD